MADPSNPSAPSPQRIHNPGAPFDPAWIAAARPDSEAVARHAASLARPQSLAPDEEAGRLLGAVRCLDLTTLAGDDTPGRVAALCATARQPLAPAVLEVLAPRIASGGSLAVAAVCVYPALVPTAVSALAGSPIPVAAVAGGFPAGQLPLPLKVGEIEWVVAAGATEVDAVISRALALQDDWRALYNEVRAFKAACGQATLKVILATGELGDLRRVARASRTCLLAGADFIKTSTGKETVNATLPVGLVMAQAIADYGADAGYLAGIKPAGGIRHALDTLAWQDLVRTTLGPAWLDPTRFRLGASSVLASISRRLAESATAAW